MQQHCCVGEVQPALVSCPDVMRSRARIANATARALASFDVCRLKKSLKEEEEEEEDER